jgi:hypothetical protein
MFRRGCEARSKYFSAWTLNRLLLLGGGLEPRFMVLFSAVFHVFPRGISIRVETCGTERSKSVVFCGGSTYKSFMCVDRRLHFRGDVKNASIPQC